MAESRQSVNRPGRAKRTVLAGCGMLVIAVPLLLLPTVLGRWEPNKYLVVAGLLLLFAGAGCALHGTIDLLRSK